MRAGAIWTSMHVCPIRRTLINKCGDVRMMLFAENGFPISELAQLTIGLVAMRAGGSK